MEIASIVLAIVGALMYLGGGIANFFATKKTNDTNQQQYEDWKEYNTPLNQKERLREAGLNPYMINGVGNTLSEPFRVGETPNFGSMLQNLGSFSSNLAGLNENVHQKQEQRALTEKIQSEKLKQTWESLKIRDRLAAVAEKRGDAAAALLWKQGSIAQINSEILKRSKSFIIGSKFYDYLRKQQEYSFNELMNPQILDFYGPFKNSEISRNYASAAAARQNAIHLSFMDRYLTNRLLFDKDRFYNFDFPFKVNSFNANWWQRQVNFYDKLQLSKQYYDLAKKKLTWDLIFKGYGAFQKDRNEAIRLIGSLLPY